MGFLLWFEGCISLALQVKMQGMSLSNSCARPQQNEHGVAILKRTPYNWVAVKELELSYHNPEARSCTIHPCHGNLNEVP